MDPRIARDLRRNPCVRPMPALELRQLRDLHRIGSSAMSYPENSPADCPILSGGIVSRAAAVVARGQGCSPALALGGWMRGMPRADDLAGLADHRHRVGCLCPDSMNLVCVSHELAQSARASSHSSWSASDS